MHPRFGKYLHCRILNYLRWITIIWLREEKKSKEKKERKKEKKEIVSEINKNKDSLQNWQRERDKVGG